MYANISINIRYGMAGCKDFLDKWEFGGVLMIVMFREITRTIL